MNERKRRKLIIENFKQGKKIFLKDQRKEQTKSSKIIIEIPIVAGQIKHPHTYILLQTNNHPSSKPKKKHDF